MMKGSERGVTNEKRQHNHGAIIRNSFAFKIIIESANSAQEYYKL